jgi:hypothetical protein
MIEILAWSPAGYRNRRRKPMGIDVTVLTPRSAVAALCSGYVPEIHPSARMV